MRGLLTSVLFRCLPWRLWGVSGGRKRDLTVSHLDWGFPVRELTSYLFRSKGSALQLLPAGCIPAYNDELTNSIFWFLSLDETNLASSCLVFPFENLLTLEEPDLEKAIRYIC